MATRGGLSVEVLSVQKIIGVLPRLTPEDRRRLRAALDFVDRRKTPVIAQATDARDSTDWMLLGLERELRRRGLYTGKLTPDYVRRMAPNYKEDITRFCKYYGRRIRKMHPELKHAEFLTLGTAFAKALADYLPRVFPPGVALGPQTLLQGIKRLPEAIQASFPDYIPSGMVTVLLRERV